MMRPSLVEARQWVTLGYNPQVSVDVDSIKGEGNTRTFWDEIIFNEEKYINGYRYRRRRALTFVDCQANKIGHLSVVLYNSEGEVVESFDRGYLSVPLVLSSVVPDSIGEAELLYICSLRSSTGGRGSALNQAEAVVIINEWLQAKSKIFAPPFDHNLVSKLTTGERYRQTINAQNWLQSNNAYYRYGEQKITGVKQFIPSRNRAVINVFITEETVLYINGKVDSSNTGVSSGLYSFTLEAINNNWKISSSKKLSS